MSEIKELSAIAELREQARQCRIIGSRFNEQGSSALYELADAIEAQADRLERLLNGSAKSDDRPRDHGAGILNLKRHALAAW